MWHTVKNCIATDGTKRNKVALREGSLSKSCGKKREWPYA